MLQTYKLRLGDGTVLAVDHAGLSTWLVDRSAMVQAAGSRHWRPLREFLAEERIAARRAPRQKSYTRQELPLVYPKPREDPPSHPQAAPPTSDAVEPLSIDEPAGVQALAEEPAVPSTPLAAQEAIPEEEVPLEPLEDKLPEAANAQVVAEELIAVDPPQDEEPVRSAAPSERDAEPPQTGELEEVEAWVEEPPQEDIPLIPLDPPEGDVPVIPAPSSWSDLPEPPRSARPSLQVLADDPVARPAEPTRTTSTPDDGLPIIRLKPLDDLDKAPPYAASGRGRDEEQRGEVFEATPRRDPFEETLLRLISAYDALLTGWIDRLARRASAGSAARRSDDDVAPPIIRLKPLADEAPPRAAPKSSTFRRRASAWVGNVTGWLGRFTRQVRPFPPVPPNEPAVTRGSDPASPEPLKAPPPISELPLLRLADPPEPKDAGDVYERESLLQAAWRWTKRIVVMSGLVAGCLLAALTWDTWSPKAARLGRMVVAEIDKRVQSRDLTERQRRALEEATEQLPHLSPDTLRLVLSRSPESVLDPPEVFSLACDAADRGLSALTSGEAGELKALRHELLDKLRPSERERVREYDSTRTRRVAFPFENRDVLDLFASGARVLPSRSRQRLQELLGKAIAAGLVLPTEVAPRPVAKR